MEAALIASFVRQYGAESWIRKEGFIAKDEYYRFNDILTAELATLERENFFLQKQLYEVCAEQTSEKAE